MESMENSATKLAPRIADLFRTGPLVQFRCEPPSATESERVTIIATFFLSSTSGPELRPIVTCKESETFSLQLAEESTGDSQVKAFRGDLEVGRLGSLKGVATLMLEQHPGDRPIASTVLHLFNAVDLSEAAKAPSRW